MAKAVIEGDGRLLSGTLFVPETVERSVLFVHGYGAEGRTCNQYGKLLKGLGTLSMTFDLSGHGRSPGVREELSVADHVADVLDAYNCLTSQAGVNPERVGIVGMSYGGYLAALACNGLRPKGLLLRSPPLYPDALFDKQRKEYTNEEVLAARADWDNCALAALRIYPGRVLVVASELDQVVPSHITDAYCEAALDGTYEILQGVGHSLDAAAQSQFKPILERWAAQL